MKQIIRKVFLLLLCLRFGIAYCQTDKDVSIKITNKLKAFSIDHTTEKVYLNFDKPYYAAGDTIYFKAYVITGKKHKLSNLSVVLHVDLININNKIDQSIKLLINQGITWGDFSLPDSLPKGIYRIQAYTRLMLNNNENTYFDQAIPIGSSLNNKIPENALARSTALRTISDLQFFPEGGKLVAGIRSKIAFKAIGTNGLGTKVKGIVLDSENKLVTNFASAHLGMGYFSLTPVDGQTYRAKLIDSDGSEKLVDLPKADQKGIILSVDNDSLSKATVTIEANKAFYQENKNRQFCLLIYSGGTAVTVPCTLDSNIVSLDILKRRLHTGVTMVTLFSPAGEPFCERILFVQNYDQLNLRVSSNKQIYATREKVSIKLKVKTRADSATVGHFSISVIDENKVQIEENSERTILTNLLLTSDLKGYVEQPNYYFSNITDKTSSDLDLVMLTHGYRRFDWKLLINDAYPPTIYQPETGLEITGIAKNALGKPLVNGTVSLISPKGGPVISHTTDDKGNFRFGNLLFTDSAKFILQAVNSKGKNSTTLVYNKEAADLPVKTSSQNDPLNQQMTAYLENVKKQHDEAVKYGKANGIMLKEVKIRQSKKHIIDEDYPSSSLLGPGHADQVIHRSEFRGGGLFSDQFNGTLRGVAFLGPNGQKRAYLLPVYKIGMNGAGAMLLVVDGVILHDGIIDDINVNDIETIEVLKYASTSIYGMQGGSGVLVITTRQGGQNAKDIQAVGILPITAYGFYKAREFYSPKYDHPNDNINRPDLRSTIYWNPEVVTGKDGNASFEYYNADGTGTYRVVVEGIDEKGNLGRQVYRYKVE